MYIPALLKASLHSLTGVLNYYIFVYRIDVVLVVIKDMYNRGSFQ